MSTMTSIWDTGTYDLLVTQDPEGKPGDLMIVVFAKPADPEDTAADEDAPLLAHIDVAREDYDKDVPPYLLDINSCGERGLVQPEDVEKLFEPKLAIRILLALDQAADRDMQGLNMDGQPFRPPSADARPAMLKFHSLLMDLKYRLYGTSP